MQERPTTEPLVSNRTSGQALLNGLEQYLTKEIADRHQIRQTVENTVDRVKKSSNERHLSFPEGAFLNLYGIPPVSRYLTSAVDLTKQEAKVALLSESYQHWPEVCSDSPRSKEKHPFKKTIGEDMQAIVARWWLPSIKTSPLAQLPVVPILCAADGAEYRRPTVTIAPSGVTSIRQQDFLERSSC